MADPVARQAIPTILSMDEMLDSLQTQPAATRACDGWRRPLLSGEGFRHDYDVSVASGGWQFYRLGKGLSLAITDMVAARPMPRRHRLNDHLVLSAMLEGSIPVRDSSGAPGKISSGHCIVYGQPGGTETTSLYETGRALKWVTVFIERRAFLEVTGLHPHNLPEHLHQFLTSGSELPLQSVPLGPAASLAARQIMECSYAEGFLSAFLKAKALELVCLTLLTLAHAREAESMRDGRLSLRDRYKVLQAMSLIEANLQRAPEIEELVDAVGLCRPKLQLGFRLLYGDTVAQVRTRCRMEHALKLVRTSGLAMVDIAAEIGYDHPASFTRAFKAMYGESPLKLRRIEEQASVLARADRARAGSATSSRA